MEVMISRMLQKRNLQPVQKVESAVSKKFKLNEENSKQLVAEILNKMQQEKKLDVFHEGQYKFPIREKQLLLEDGRQIETITVVLPETKIAPYGLYPVPLEEERLPILVSDECVVMKENLQDTDFNKQYHCVHEKVYFNVYESQEREIFFIGHEVYDVTEDSKGIVPIIIEKLGGEFPTKEEAFEVMDRFINQEMGVELEKDLENIIDVETVEIEVLEL
ncbi:hypothetical protein [Bacillus sp. MUM 116]|uniref:hypothetical protein n=1 Tax=Bacillus sp. MUM 116 TaxID=1678002 RepID=UPI00210A5FA9|nr:hypothetical protein [Bacillus sp. MUM 116]